jgi:Ca-activated chloride channel family protein
MTMRHAEMDRRLIAPVLLCVFLLAPAAASQETPHKVFSSRSEVVLVHVAVLDGKSHLVSGLPESSFSVFENGQPQPITFFHNQDNPVTVGLALDCSTSMVRKREAIIAAGLAFARSSHPADELFTINFNERIWTGLPPSLPFTTDVEQLRGALERTTARGQTAMFDGVQFALQHLQKGRRQKKVLILVSDGGDNASTATFDDVLSAAQRTDAVIYAISLFDQYNRDAKPNLLRKLTQATGGKAYFPDNPDDSTAVLEQIAHDIRSGYTLGYVPSATGEGYRSIRVDVRAPDGRKLSVRARPGYMAGHGAGGHEQQ